MAFNFRKNKYGAKRADGFASKLERAVFEILTQRAMNGEIRNIKRQQTVILVNCDACGTEMKWNVDFSFEEIESGKTVYAEAKGVECREYKRKLKQWKKDPPYDLEIFKGSWSHPKLVERIKKND